MMKNMYYPINLDVRGKKCLVIGGGKVATQKVRGLLRAGAEVTVIAPAIRAPLERVASRGEIHLKRDHFKTAHLRGAFLTIIATDDRETNSKIALLLGRKHSLINVVDQPKACTFTVPSLYRQGPLTIAISTEGTSPSLAKKIRKDLGKIYGREFGMYLRLMGRMRQGVIQKIPSCHVRKRLFERVATSALPLLRKGKVAEAKGRIQTLLNGKTRS